MSNLSSTTNSETFYQNEWEEALTYIPNYYSKDKEFRETFDKKVKENKTLGIIPKEGEDSLQALLRTIQEKSVSKNEAIWIPQESKVEGHFNIKFLNQKTGEILQFNRQKLEGDLSSPDSKFDKEYLIESVKRMAAAELDSIEYLK